MARLLRRRDSNRRKEALETGGRDAVNRNTRSSQNSATGKTVQCYSGQGKSTSTVAIRFPSIPRQSASNSLGKLITPLLLASKRIPSSVPAKLPRRGWIFVCQGESLPTQSQREFDQLPELRSCRGNSEVISYPIISKLTRATK